MTDLNSLEIFARVVDANSFSEAARRLKMPLSTVSRRIADLEDQLGIRLLERSTRNMRLTDAGCEVLEQARQAVELSNAVDNIISDHRSHVRGTLRLSAPPSISDSLIAPLAGAFQASYADVRVQVFITDRVVDQIAEGGFGGSGKEMSAVFESGIPVSHHSQPCFVNERSRLKSLARCLLSHFRGCHASQFVIYQGHCKNILTHLIGWSLKAAHSQ
jgi:molybdenum-dependent DNA-binding transcriptional regulator ModE